MADHEVAGGCDVRCQSGFVGIVVGQRDRMVAEMTQKQLDDLTECKAQLDHLTACYYRRRNVLQVRRKALLDACDHERPDGETAITGGFLLGGCAICHKPV